jgi:hypothetical protein
MKLSLSGYIADLGICSPSLIVLRRDVFRLSRRILTARVALYSLAARAVAAIHILDYGFQSGVGGGARPLDGTINQPQVRLMLGESGRAGFS